MSGAAPQPVTFDRDFGGAIANLRETTKWIVGAVATAAAGVLLGAPLTKIGALPLGGRLALASAAAVVGFCAIGVIYAFAVQVIGTESISIGSLASGQSRSGRKRVDRLQAWAKPYMPVGCVTFQNIVDARASLTKSANSGVASAIADLATMDAQINTMRAPLAYEEKRLRFMALQRSLIALGPLLVVSFCLFAWAATPSDPAPPLSVKPTTVAIVTADTPETRVGLGFQAGCYDVSASGITVPTVRVAEYPGYADVIALPRAPCSPRRLVIRNGRPIFR